MTKLASLHTFTIQHKVFPSKTLIRAGNVNILEEINSPTPMSLAGTITNIYRVEWDPCSVNCKTWEAEVHNTPSPEGHSQTWIAPWSIATFAKVPQCPLGYIQMSECCEDRRGSNLNILTSVNHNSLTLCKGSYSIPSSKILRTSDWNDSDLSRTPIEVIASRRKNHRGKSSIILWKSETACVTIQQYLIN